MQNKNQKITIEWVKEVNNNKIENNTSKMSNPITNTYSDIDKIQIMIKKILNEEFPMIKDNSLLYNLVLYSLIEKLKTVQSVKNVLSYIKDNNVKKIHDVSFKNGEVYIKCST